MVFGTELDGSKDTPVVGGEVAEVIGIEFHCGVLVGYVGGEGGFTVHLPRFQVYAKNGGWWGGSF